MVKNHTFRFRVTKSQFEKIKQEALVKGHLTVAPYVRDLALNHTDFIESKIIENNQMLKKLLEVLCAREI